MNVYRIGAVPETARVRSGEGHQPLPAPGDTVLLTLDELLGDEVLATSRSGLSLRLTGLDALSRDLRPGDTLTMRVVANEPGLELQLYSAGAESRSDRSAPLALGDYPSMRLDLAELRAISWAAPNPADLAAAWQSQAMDKLMFPIFVWSGAQRGGIQMSLCMVDPDEEQPRGSARRRPRAVQIDFWHSVLGHVVIKVDWRLGGIQLDLGVEPSAAQAVRAQIPAVVAALGRANLRLVRVRLTPARGEALRARAMRPTVRAWDAAPALDGRLFRAAAETAVTLLSPGSPRY